MPHLIPSAVVANLSSDPLLNARLAVAIRILPRDAAPLAPEFVSTVESVLLAPIVTAAGGSDSKIVRDSQGAYGLIEHPNIGQLRDLEAYYRSLHDIGTVQLTMLYGEPGLTPTMLLDQLQAAIAQGDVPATPLACGERRQNATNDDEPMIRMIGNAPLPDRLEEFAVPDIALWKNQDVIRITVQCASVALAHARALSPEHDWLPTFIEALQGFEAHLSAVPETTQIEYERVAALSFIYALQDIASKPRPFQQHDAEGFAFIGMHPAYTCPVLGILEEPIAAYETPSLHNAAHFPTVVDRQPVRLNYQRD